MRTTLLLSSLYLLLPSLCLLIAGCRFPGGAPAREDPAPDGGAGRDGAAPVDAAAITGGTSCKEGPTAGREFSDQILRAP